MSVSQSKSDTGKEAPTVEIYTPHVAAVNRSEAAFLGVRSERASLVNAGMNHARTLNSAPGRRPAGCALRRVPACPGLPTMQLVPMAAVLPVVNHARKQTNVHKTRISAGRYGAMGPHPEREPA